MTDLPLDSNAKRPKFFDSDSNDALTSMMLEIMAELWTVKERVYVLEEVLSSEGEWLKQKIEDFEPNVAQITQLETQRATFISSVMRSLEERNAKGPS
jgi:hypothetical protein